MSEPAPVPRLASFRRRFLVAMALGHLAAAYAAVASLFLCGALDDLARSGPDTLIPSSIGRVLEGLVAAPISTGLISLYAAALMLPITLLLSPIALLAARTLRTNLAATMLLGALTPLVPGTMLAVHNLARPGGGGFAWVGLIPPCAAGAAFGAIIWLGCIRPRRRGLIA